MFRLLREIPEDGFEVEMLLDLAFAPGRTALSSYQLREGVEPIGDLCTIVRDEYDQVVGCIRFWPIRIGEVGSPALLLGPIAVHPTRQSEGLGALLIGDSLERARDLGWRLVILVGDPPYYSRFGFQPATPLGIHFPQPVNRERVLIRELVEDSTIGISGMVTNWGKGGI